VICATRIISDTQTAFLPVVAFCEQQYDVAQLHIPFVPVIVLGGPELDIVVYDGPVLDIISYGATVEISISEISIAEISIAEISVAAKAVRWSHSHIKLSLSDLCFTLLHPSVFHITLSFDFGFQ
jgi:hypothetical protein